MLKDLLYNRVLIAGIAGWASAQVLKVFTNFIKIKKIDLKRLKGSGGMPSSHSAFVMAISTKTGIVCGFGSPLFALAICFAFIVMYDAAGVRRAAGNQARVLNQIIADLSKGKSIQQEKLLELIGHTPFEVIIGAFLGITVGIAA